MYSDGATVLGTTMMPKPKKRRETSDAIEIMHRRYFEGKPDRMAMLEEELANAELSRLVYDLRTEAKLTQAQLAKRVGTTQSVISRLEDADYEGHSLAMRGRIARTKGCVVEIRVRRSERAQPPRVNRERRPVRKTRWRSSASLLPQGLDVVPKRAPGLTFRTGELR
jgi:transcriptional regulator with XRE-family HTH domain